MGDPQPETDTVPKNNIRFAVTAVPLRDESLETDEFPNENTIQCPSTAENTIGYSTHEAVPMTLFYRNESSHIQGQPKGKARPTLDQLRKGFEANSPETQVCTVVFKYIL